MRRAFFLVLLAIALWAGWRNWQLRPVPQPAGMIAPTEPHQRPLDPPVSAIVRGDYSIQPLAAYDITARLLSREPYYSGRTADLSPLDFALGWGPMSDSDVLAQLKIHQGGRFYYMRWDSPPTIPQEILFITSANTHLLPATRGVRRALDRMRPGQVVHLRGYLVNVTGPDGWYWHSSTTRNDTGDGACEVMWVEQAFTENRR